MPTVTYLCSGGLRPTGCQNVCTPTISTGFSSVIHMTNVFQSLLLLIAGATQKELARQVKYLKVENEILRSKLPKRITITPKEKNRLVRFALKRAGRCCVN